MRTTQAPRALNATTPRRLPTTALALSLFSLGSGAWAGDAAIAALSNRLDARAPGAAPSATTSADPADTPKPDERSYCGRNLGSWFYCERPAPVPQDAPAENGASDAADPPEIKALADYQRALEIATTVATWNPTPDNVQRYIELQKIGLDKSSLFSDQWRRLIWTHPDLDYTRQRPVAQLAKNEYDDERRADRDIFLRGVASQVGVFYVYSGHCAPCRVASPIVKDFADRYSVTVKVISTDGAPNPVLGPTLVDRGQLAGWGVDRKITPALLLYQSPSRVNRAGEAVPFVITNTDGEPMTLRACLNPRGCITYLGAGVMAGDDIAERMFILLSKPAGSDY